MEMMPNKDFASIFLVLFPLLIIRLNRKPAKKKDFGGQINPLLGLLLHGCLHRKDELSHKIVRGP